MINRNAINIIIVTGLLLAALSNLGMAQTKVQVGPYFGTGIRMLTNNNTPDLGFGYRIGVVTRVPLSEAFAMVPSVTFSRKGFIKYKFETTIPNGISNQKLNYLDFIIPAKYTIGRGFTLQAGLQVGVLLNATYTYDSQGIDRFKTNIKDELHPIDMGFVYGLGMQTDNGFGLELMFNHGFSNIYKNDTPVYYLDKDFNLIGEPEMNGKNLFVALNFYYLIGFKKVEKE